MFTVNIYIVENTFRYSSDRQLADQEPHLLLITFFSGIATF